MYDHAPVIHVAYFTHNHVDVFADHWQEYPHCQSEGDVEKLNFH